MSPTRSTENQQSPWEMNEPPNKHLSKYPQKQVTVPQGPIHHVTRGPMQLIVLPIFLVPAKEILEKTLDSVENPDFRPLNHVWKVQKLLCYRSVKESTPLCAFWKAL